MIVAANWKMNMSFHKAIDFLAQFTKQINEKQDLKNFIFFPPASLFGQFHKLPFYWGGQNVYHQITGAFTGETSAKTLKEMGAGFCLLGHSERRRTFGETDVEIEKKFLLLQEQALVPVLCVGESLTDRPNQQNILKNQLSWIKNYKKYDKLPWKPDFLPLDFKDTPFIIAYEPLWSIGTGETPDAEEINKTALFIKEYLPYPGIKVFYGGSVDTKNVKSFSKMRLVDGLLVGKASLDPQELYNIYQQVNEKNL